MAAPHCLFYNTTMRHSCSNSNALGGFDSKHEKLKAFRKSKICFRSMYDGLEALWGTLSSASLNSTNTFLQL